MQMLKKSGESVLLAGLVFLLFLVLFEHRVLLPAWLQVGGRIHPLFVHFPIVLVLLVLLLHWLPPTEGNFPDTPAADLLRLFTALAAVFAAIFGMLLSMEGRQSGTVLSLHKWGGIFSATLAAGYYRYYAYLRIPQLPGRLFTIGAAAGILLTGHWGGSLTHGENYLLEPVQHNSHPRVPADQAIVYENIIKPILSAKCLKCHNGDLAKGSLVMDKLSGIRAGGKTGPLFVAGQPDLSLIIQRIHLPEEEKKHMPPTGKTQLTSDESRLLVAWVKAGSPTDKKLFSLPLTDSFRSLAQRWLSSLDDELGEPQYSFSAASEKKILALNNNYRVIEPQGKHSPALSVHFYGKNAFSGIALQELSVVHTQIIDLSLARMPAKDNDLVTVGKMENLRRLNLNYTDLTDMGLDALAGCRQLQTISLSGTAVTSKGLEKILSLPAILEVYAWDTKIDTAAFSRLRKKYNHISIYNGFIDDGSFKVSLSQPILGFGDSMFNPSITLSLKHPYHGAQIKYTMDGSQPDSTHGLLYVAPISFDSTTFLVARAFKQGWLGSRPVSALYLRALRPDSIAYLTPLDTAYKNIKPRTLIDGDIGTGVLNSDDGSWAGYINKDAAIMTFYKKPVSLSLATVFTLQQGHFNNYPPTKIQIWGGMDLKHMKLLAANAPSQLRKEDPEIIARHIIHFRPSTVRCIKIIATGLRKLPDWSEDKKKKPRMFISEIVMS